MQLGQISNTQEVRCAIYTRRSVEQGPDQFTSLEAQRVICSSYIASQKPNGWTEIPKHYDDEGWTGANLRRPALQELLSDIECGLVDVVIIYKLDRITRSLLDFVRLADLFEQFNVSFVAVTQNFDTRDSTGRLILNVLLTFAQFEREIAGDRLRDKFSAMRQQGLFVGGNPPYGYDLIDKKLVINETEAEITRWMFRRYLEVKSYPKIARELAERGIIRRSRTSKRGNFVQGRCICQGAIVCMLRNPLYVGQVQSKGKCYPGVHDAIVSKELWDEVQALRGKRTRAKVVELHREDLLKGLMYDSYGRLMGSFRDYRHKTKRRYYISNQSEWGRRHGVRRYRTKADELDQLILAGTAALLCDRERLRAMLLRLGVHCAALNKYCAKGAKSAQLLEQLRPRQAQSALRALIERIELSGTLIKIFIRTPELPRFLDWDGVAYFKGERDSWDRPHITDVVDVPANTICIKREFTLLLKRTNPSANTPNPRLVALLKKARVAQALLDQRDVVDVNALAARVHCSPKKLTSLVRLNYLAPDIIASILDGTQPRHINCTTLRSYHLPMDWSLQRKMLGFPDQPDFLRAAPGW